MKCPQCGVDIQEGVVCPECGTVRSEDFFNSSPKARRDTKHRLYLMGCRRVTSRMDLKSSMAQLASIIIILSLLTLAVLYLTFWMY
jgi:transcription initiation factor TFIIIB Brf1 subunit/transcription initiation factor TFIIB